MVIFKHTCLRFHQNDLKEIDVIAADLTQTWSRMSIVDFSKPFLATSLTLLLKVIYYIHKIINKMFNV